MVAGIEATSGPNSMGFYLPKMMWLLIPPNIQLASNRDKLGIPDITQSLKETNQPFGGKAELLPHWTGINTYSDYRFTFPAHKVFS